MGRTKLSLEEGCPFCRRTSQADCVARSDVALAFWDAYPVTPGHALVIPRRHEPDYFGLTREERSALWALVDEVCEHLEERFEPDSFNIGINAGRAAGQTIAHAHVHVIPRYEGDVVDPRGGIRHVIPEKAVYWEDGKDAPDR